jgi:hypothetical protein
MKAYVGDHEYEVTKSERVKVVSDLLYGTFYAYHFTYDDPYIQAGRKSVLPRWTTVIAEDLPGVARVNFRFPALLCVKRDTIVTLTEETEGAGVGHDAYPHLPGQLYDCPACENECFCDADDPSSKCVHCALEDEYASEEC